jgi:MFS family permease
VRRLLVLVSAVVFVETIFFAALAPLLPAFEDDLDLGKLEAGVLTAAYAAGAIVGALPAGRYATRVGVRPVVVGGMVVLGIGSVLFGLADAYWLLVVARLAQGVGAAGAWTGGLAWVVDAAPRERRGEVIGIALAAAIGGALMGPVVGGLSSAIGREPVFGAIGGLAFVLAIWASREPAPAPGLPQPLRAMLSALRDPVVRVGIWLLTLPAFLHGTLSVLAPLRLDDFGWGTAGITVIFVVAALVEASLNPSVGRWSDRRGRLAPIRAGLVVAAVPLAALPFMENRWTLAACVVLAGVAFAGFWTPSMAMLTDGTEALGLHHALAFALMNMAFAPGEILGAAIGGALGEYAGDAVPFVLCSALCLVSIALLVRGGVPTAQAAPARAR